MSASTIAIQAGNAVDLGQADFCHIALGGIPGNVVWLVYRWYNASALSRVALVTSR